jgi:hypothetical protein
MALVRLIFVTVSPQDSAAAERLWKEACAPLMITQEGASPDARGMLIAARTARRTRRNSLRRAGSLCLKTRRTADTAIAIA